MTAIDNRVNELPNQRRLLAILESNLQDLGKLLALTVGQTGSGNGELMMNSSGKEEILIAEIEENLKSLQKVENMVTSHLITEGFIGNYKANNSVKGYESKHVDGGAWVASEKWVDFPFFQCAGCSFLYLPFLP